MKDRLITLAGALGALAVIVGLLYSPQQLPDYSAPLSTEARKNGYLGLQRWLTSEGVATLSLRQRFSQLPHLNSTATGNILITTLPYKTALRQNEIAPIQNWVAAGNTLIMLTALNDSPDWLSFINTVDFIADIEAISGLHFAVYLEDDEEDLALNLGELLTATDHVITPEPRHPLMNSVQELSAISDSITSLWWPDLWEYSGFVARMASEKEHGFDALWQLPVGKGQIILSANSTLLSNRMLGKADNAQFFANTLAYHLEPGGSVIFDDMHQGLSDAYDPSAFYSDTRLHTSLWFLAGFWLVYLLAGSSRLAPFVKKSKPPQHVHLVHSISQFLQRKLSPVEAGKAMVDQWLSDLQRAGQLHASDTDIWSELESSLLIDQMLLSAVRTSYSALGRGEKVSLIKLHNNIQTLKRSMT